MISGSGRCSPVTCASRMRRQTGPEGVTGSTEQKWVERRDWGGGCARPVGLVPEGVGIACVDVGVDGQPVLFLEEDHKHLHAASTTVCGGAGVGPMMGGGATREKESEARGLGGARERAAAPGTRCLRTPRT